MARKSGDAPNSKNGLNDVIGIVHLLFGGLLLLAQLSFDRFDLAFYKEPHNKHVHNLIGPMGAHLAHWFFVLLGLAAYLVPWICGLFGVAYLFGVLSLSFLRERVRWCSLWAVVLLIAVTGVFYILDAHNLAGYAREYIGASNAGGEVGRLTFEYVFWMLGNLGAVIVYSALGLISLLFLTNFQLGGWIRALWQKEGAAPEDEFKSPEEIALEKRALELEKQKRKLEEQVGRSEKTEKVASGLGADGLPVPEPTVRDLSVPQAKGPRVTKTTLPPKAPKEAAPPAEPVEVGQVIPAGEIKPATTDEILGRKSEVPGSAGVSPTNDEPKPAAGTASLPAEAPADKLAEPKPEPVIIIADGSVPPPRPKPAPRKPKPMTVASVPMIGNYQLPSMDFLQHADMTVKPTESKEELMANARLMQQTLAQFDIEVALGDITKGPTITRYELHPAPGVKLEKITALSNNIAAALKAERIHILAPVPGKSSVGVEVPNLIKTKVIMRDLFESDEWRNTKARIPIALGKDVYGHPIVADLAEMPHCLIAGSTGSGKSVCINSIIASLLLPLLARPASLRDD